MIEVGDGKWKAHCPVPDHQDRDRSLSIRRGEKAVMIHCFAGCNCGEVQHALGLHWSDLFGEPDREVTMEKSPATSLTDTEKSDLYWLFLAGLPRLGVDGREDGDLAARGLWYGRQKALSHEGNRLAVYRLGGAQRAIANLTPEQKGRLLLCPGFVKDDTGEAAPSLPSSTEGVALAFVDENDLVRGIQVRTGKKGSKYQWLSGGLGGSVGSPYHVALVNREHLGRGFRVTEGWIKAESSAFNTQVPTVGISGTASWQTIVDLAERIRPAWVDLAFDMDWETNAAVRRCRRDLATALCYRQIDVYHERWDPKFKGIDDLLASGSREIERTQVVPRGE